MENEYRQKKEEDRQKERNAAILAIFFFLRGDFVFCLFLLFQPFFICFSLATIVHF